MKSPSPNIPRHWWGKILGAVIGLFRGGFAGALFGALLGHMLDRLIANFTGVGSTRESFFQALFSALGHVSKADGKVTDVEIRMAEELMRRMQITGEERRKAIKFFNLGKQAEFDLHSVLAEFVRNTGMRFDLRQMFMEILIEAAFTSGKVTEAEVQVLLKVARELRIPGNLFSAMMQARSGGAGAQYQQQGGVSGVTKGSLSQAYAHLGLDSKASDAEVKKAFRKLVSQYHPDKLVSRGLPEKMMDMAKTRVREINIAYEQIKKARGFK
jgi:DnaJ like chaperone protein